MDTVFIHKGVECHFSKSANAKLDTDEHKTHFLDNFFKHEPLNGIKWVTIEEVESLRGSDAALPMYSIRNSEGDVLLIWPMLDNSNLYLYIESLIDRPDLKREIKLD